MQSDNSDLLESMRQERNAWRLERETLQNTILSGQQQVEAERRKLHASEQKLAEAEAEYAKQGDSQKTGIRREMCQTLCRTVGSLVDTVHRIDKHAMSAIANWRSHHHYPVSVMAYGG